MGNTPHFPINSAIDTSRSEFLSLFALHTLYACLLSFLLAPAHVSPPLLVRNDIAFFIIPHLTLRTPHSLKNSAIDTSRSEFLSLFTMNTL